MRQLAIKRVALLALTVGVLAACETPQKAPVVPAPKPPSEPETPPPPPPPSPIPSGPVPSGAQQQALKIAQSAAEMLESGNEESAKLELKRALSIDPQNKLALNLTRQMAPDALSTLPRESFAYTVRPGETMSRISQRFLNDTYAFYILARYNDIKVPKLVSAGQVIRIPGKAPAPGAVPPPPPVEPALRSPPVSAPPPPSPPPPPPEPPAGERAMRSATAFERSGDLVHARAEYQNAASLGQPGASARAEQMLAQLVSRYSTAARVALARQDLDGSIANWERVLELDPNNTTANLELGKVRGLKEKLKNVK